MPRQGYKYNNSRQNNPSKQTDKTKKIKKQDNNQIDRQKQLKKNCQQSYDISDEEDSYIEVGVQQNIDKNTYLSVQNPKDRIEIGMELEEVITKQIEKLKDQKIQKVSAHQAKIGSQKYNYSIDQLVKENGETYAIVFWHQTQELLSSLQLDENKIQEYENKFNAQEKYCSRINRVPLTDEQLLYINQILSIQLTDDIIDVLRMLFTLKKLTPVFENSYQEKVFTSFMKYDAKYMIMLEDIDVAITVDKFCMEHEIDHKVVAVSIIKPKQKTCILKLEFKKILQYTYFKDYFLEKSFNVKSLDHENQSETVISILKKLFKQVININQKQNEQNEQNQKKTLKEIAQVNNRNSLKQSPKNIRAINFAEDKNDDNLIQEQQQQEQQQQKQEQQEQQQQQQEQQQQEYQQQQRIFNNISPIKNSQQKNTIIDDRVLQETGMDFEKEVEKNVNLQNNQIEKTEKKDVLLTADPSSDIISYIIEFSNILNDLSQNPKYCNLVITYPGKKIFQLSELKKEHDSLFEQAKQFRNTAASEINSNQISMFRTNYLNKYYPKSSQNFILNKIKNEKNFTLDHLGQLKFFKK